MSPNPANNAVAKPASRRRATSPGAEPSLATHPQQQGGAIALVESLGDLLSRSEALAATSGPRAVAARAAVLDALQKHPPESLEVRAAVAALRRWVEDEEKRQPGLAIPIASTDDPRRSKHARADWHGHVLSGLVYHEVLREPVSHTLAESDASIRDDILNTAVQHVADMAAAIQPRDPIERQLVEQMVVQHARYLSLSRLASQQSDLETLVKLNEAADRVANTHRRMALALAEYRNPRAIRQVINQQNNAQQQVVQNSHPSGTSPDECDKRTRIQ